MVQVSQALFVTSTDGTRIFAEARGDSSNPCIVFHHGMSVGMGCFDEIFADPRWTSTLFLVRYDIRGHGMSPVDPEESTKWASARFAEDFDAVIGHFGVVKPFFAAWSYGATVLSDILTAHGPTYLAGLILVAPQPTLVYPDLLRPEAAAFIPGFITSTDVQLFKTTVGNFVDSFVKKPLRYSTRFTIMGAVLAQPAAVVHSALSRPQDATIFFGVAAKKLPLLLFLGEHDKTLYSPKLKADCEQEWVEIETVVLDAGHAVFLDCHNKVRESTLEFVKSHSV
ncbi:Alpha/Beta hydrolase protein [Mycena polygramma]|nr:Alpha/Beta hydrolase protein [Mycena polygramma]